MSESLDNNERVWPAPTRQWGQNGHFFSPEGRCWASWDGEYGVNLSVWWGPYPNCWFLWTKQKGVIKQGVDPPDCADFLFDCLYSASAAKRLLGDQDDTAGTS